ncbi:MAG: holo-ACP synthase [Thermoleophilia bacterium]
MLVGVDIIENERMARVIARRPRLLERVFTRQEREYCLSKANPARHFAARFAAKEALGKALGTGVISWQEIEVINAASGQPAVRVSGRTEAAARRAGAGPLSLSLSHSDSASVAVVVARRLRTGNEDD